MKLLYIVFFFTFLKIVQSFLAESIFPINKCLQGHKCVYYRGGSLLNTISDPGYRLKLPIITEQHNIQITWQNDKLTDIICGSSRGGRAFLDIDVVNKLSNNKECILKVVGEHTIDYDKPLIFDYIPSEVAQFCKNYTLDDIVIREFDKLDEVLLDKLRENIESYGLSNCIEIKKVRISKPRLDDEMRKKFEAIENEQKEKELALQKKETEKVRLETQLQKEIMEKERQKKTTEIDMQIQIDKANSMAKKQKIQDKMNLETAKSKAESERYMLEERAKGMEMLLYNKDYIKYEAIKSAYHNSKIVIGEIPTNSLFNFGNLNDSNDFDDSYDSYNAFYNLNNFTY